MKCISLKKTYLVNLKPQKKNLSILQTYADPKKKKKSNIQNGSHYSEKNKIKLVVADPRQK